MEKKTWMKTALAPLAFAAAAGMLGATPAMAAPSPDYATVAASQLSQEDEAAIREHLELYGVTGADADSVVAKAATGETLDADTGVAPVSTDNVQVEGLDYTVDRFADGSFIALNIAPPASDADANSRAALGQGISGCDELTSVGTQPFVNCKVSYSGSLFSADFNANFTLSTTTAASIQRVWNENANVVAGTFGQEPSVSITQQTAGASPAEARLFFTYGSTAGVAGSTGSVRLIVSGDSASVASP
ncbi:MULTISPECIES: hypothetical protein [unclassified Pseudoclavibacter]|uniref:hypothetical protein n=1 Tax=unclassified Pseudoclavibacter TaxID=2615177 RepID=UPI001BAC0EDC|nr:hypothetical protein [Pseudoclavibacter sp. Marseille-Q4354]MBS3180020.1 hypothetical protein [Pseudoclavibacter sp. Marseille-Q4354]